MHIFRRVVLLIIKRIVFIVFCVVRRVVFCGVVLYNYQPRDMERMVIEMMYRQDIENEVVDYIRNSGERVVDYDVDAIVDCLVVMYEREGVEFYRLLF